MPLTKKSNVAKIQANWCTSSLYFKIKQGSGVHYNKSPEVCVRGSLQKAGGTTLSVKGRAVTASKWCTQTKNECTLYLTINSIYPALS